MWFEKKENIKKKAAEMAAIIESKEEKNPPSSWCLLFAFQRNNTGSIHH
jgi:hypothetical protein